MIRHLNIALLVFISYAGYAQVPRPDDQLTTENLKKHSVASYSESWTFYDQKGKEKNKYDVEGWSYNEKGEPTLHWLRQMDVTVSMDTAVYVYNGRGKISKIVHYKHYPIEDKKRNEEAESRPSDTSRTYFIYGRDHQLSMRVIHNKNALIKIDTTVYQNDPSGRPVFEENQSKKTINLYNANGSIAKKTEFLRKYTTHPEGNTWDNIDTIVTKYVYDKTGNLVKENSKYHTVTYVYNDQGKVIKIFEVGKRNNKPFDYRFEFAYDEDGNLKEMKKFKSDALWDWERYEYDKRGFCTKQFYLNIKTKEVKIMVSREYQIRK